MNNQNIKFQQQWITQELSKDPPGDIPSAIEVFYAQKLFTKDLVSSDEFQQVYENIRKSYGQVMEG